MPAKTRAWALRDKYGRFVQTHDDPRHPFRTYIFRTRREASDWVMANQYWRQKASPVAVVITVKEVGEP